ncbi:MAG TPA: MarR family winged helix-turn-helix transcriptional regulator [Roseiarcus sp.]
MARTASAASSPDADGRSGRGPLVRALRERPGFLIRRLHQIHLALFATECAGEAVTPVQFSLLTALEEMDAIEQTALGHAIGLDRTSTADVLDRLQQRGLVKRKVSAQDRRRKTVCLTRSGRATVARVKAAVDRAHKRTIEALPPEDQARFLDYLVRLVEENNDIGRALLKLV